MYKGCLLSCTELTLKRSVGLDSWQRLIGVPPGSSGLSASRKVVTSSRWLPPKTFWGPGEKEKALAASVSKGSRIVDVMMSSEAAQRTVGSRQEGVENVDKQVDVEERWVTCATNTKHQRRSCSQSQCEGYGAATLKPTGQTRRVNIPCLMRSMHTPSVGSLYRANGGHKMCCK